jgi:sialic acid synthase SpsE
MHPIAIQNRIVSPQHPPLLIAEMSGNHNELLDRALSACLIMNPQRSSQQLERYQQGHAIAQETA